MSDVTADQAARWQQVGRDLRSVNLDAFMALLRLGEALAGKEPSAQTSPDITLADTIA
jgi:hypothetical protein